MRSSLNPRARHITREHVCQRYVLAGYVTCSRIAVFDSGRVGGVAMAVASSMRAVGRSRVCWRRLAAGMSGTAPVRAPLGVPAAWKRWLARIFRVRGGSCAHGEWRHCATSGREGCGAGGERYALATFFVSPDCPPPARPRSAAERASSDPTGAVPAPPAVHRGGARREAQPLRGRPAAGGPASATPFSLCCAS